MPRYVTDATAEVLALIAALEGEAEVYVHGGNGPTDLDAGFVNPTQARRLAQAGWIEPPDDVHPLRLTDEGRNLLAHRDLR